MFDTIPSDEIIEKTTGALTANGIDVQVVNTGSDALSKIVVFKRENPAMGRKVQMIIVKEILGF